MRRKKVAASPATAPTDEGTSGEKGRGKRERGRGRGRGGRGRRDRDVITSASVFSMGPAERLMQKRGGFEAAEFYKDTFSALSLSLSHTHTHTLSLSLTHTHTHTHSLSLSLSPSLSLTHTHTHTHTHTQNLLERPLEALHALQNQKKLMCKRARNTLPLTTSM